MAPWSLFHPQDPLHIPLPKDYTITSNYKVISLTLTPLQDPEIPNGWSQGLASPGPRTLAGVRAW